MAWFKKQKPSSDFDEDNLYGEYAEPENRNPARQHPPYSHNLYPPYPPGYPPQPPYPQSGYPPQDSQYHQNPYPFQNQNPYIPMENTADGAYDENYEEEYRELDEMELRARRNRAIGITIAVCYVVFLIIGAFSTPKFEDKMATFDELVLSVSEREDYSYYNATKNEIKTITAFHEQLATAVQDMDKKETNFLKVSNDMNALSQTIDDFKVKVSQNYIPDSQRNYQNRIIETMTTQSKLATNLRDLAQIKSIGSSSTIELTAAQQSLDAESKLYAIIMKQNEELQQIFGK